MTLYKLKLSERNCVPEQHVISFYRTPPAVRDAKARLKVDSSAPITAREHRKIRPQCPTAVRHPANRSMEMAWKTRLVVDIRAGILTQIRIDNSRAPIFSIFTLLYLSAEIDLTP